MSENAPLLEMKNVTKEFFGNVVLKDVNFTLEHGKILGLVGENGAGKTTLMKILFGMPVIQETGGYGGHVILEGETVRFGSPEDALAMGVGMVHQEFSLIAGFSATENILLNRESTRYNLLVELFGERLETLDEAKMKERAVEAISKLDIELDEETLVKEMPVGHKQFIEIARELDRKNIKLLVLDEPTAVLTESEAEILIKAVKHLSEEGIAFIFISHRLDEILTLCDSVVVLRDGEIVNDKKTSEITVPQIAESMVGRSMESNEKIGDSTEERVFDRTILSVRDLWVDMPGERVRNVNLDIMEGEIIGIGGLAGQGKIGIPNGVMGLYHAGGYVEFDGEEIALNAPAAALDARLAFVSEDRRGVGLLMDEPLDWNVTFTAMQCLGDFLKPYLGGMVQWRDEEQIKAVTRKYIEDLNIKCTGPKQRAVELSGGNQQKICLAKAFVMKPRLLFVSEPTRGIDVGAKKLVLDTLRRYNRDYGTTIVMVSSELEELRSICDRIAIVDEGRISGILPASSRSTEFGMLMIGNRSGDTSEASGNE